MGDDLEAMNLDELVIPPGGSNATRSLESPRLLAVAASRCAIHGEQRLLSTTGY